MVSKGLFPRRILVIRWDLSAPYLSSGLLHGFLEWLEPRFHMIFGVFLKDNLSNDSLVERIWPYPVISDALLPLLASTEDSEVTVLSFTSPEKLYEGPSFRNIGYYTWTGPLHPGEPWVFRMNSMDEIWTPMSFLKEVLLAAGVTVPVRDAPCPPRTSAPREEGDRAPILLAPMPTGENGGEGFEVSLEKLVEGGRFLIAGLIDLRPRKGLPVLIEEWLESQNRRGDSALLLIPSEGEAIVDQVNALRRLLASLSLRHETGASNIFVVSNRSGFAPFVTVLRHCAAYVTTSFGEVALEEVLHPIFEGKPVICPQSSAFQEYFSSDYPYFLRTDVENICFGGEEALPVSACWGVPREESLGEVIEKVLGDWTSDQARKTMLSVARKIQQRLERSLEELSI